MPTFFLPYVQAALFTFVLTLYRGRGEEGAEGNLTQTNKQSNINNSNNKKKTHSKLKHISLLSPLWAFTSSPICFQGAFVAAAQRRLKRLD